MRNFCFVVDVSATGSESDEENVTPPWHNETTMTISATPEKVKKRQQRKTKSTKKSLIQEEEEEDDDEETKAYKQRLRNVRKSDHSAHLHRVRFSATTQGLQRRRTQTEANTDRMFGSVFLSFCIHSDLQDAGQKMLDAIVCKRCGMAYFPHSTEDKAAHVKYHNYTTSALRLRVSGYLKKN